MKTDVTLILEAVSKGDSKAAAELLPLVYNELRKLAHARMAKLPAGNTLQPTALVHEAYIRMVGKGDTGWDNRAHFFAAASQSMRQIVVDRARRKYAAKRGGGEAHADIDDIVVAVPLPDDDVLALDEALTKLEQENPRQAEIVKMRYFAGFSREEIAAAMGVSVRTIDREWRYIVARLHQEIRGTPHKNNE